ncbi:unnamed protein product [Phytomonas sp. Hart1]|nr:unnamed protein product [Phytomonas sp. Hart1]|eukprot:CCW71637.1 unnamed protein product [Phytomonas sp. isolate Hart1]
MGPPNLQRSLYRKTLRLIAGVVRAGTAQVAAARWAEFIPSCVALDRGDDLAVIARKCFERSESSPAALSNGFNFVKEAAGSVFSIEVRALWERIIYSQGCDLVSGIGLMSASFVIAGGDLVPTASVEARAREFSTFIEQLIHKITTNVTQVLNLKSNFKHTRKTLERAHEIVVRVANIHRSDSDAENYTTFSLINESKCSEYILNIILFNVLRNMGFVCILVDSNLHFRWIRVDLADKGSSSSAHAKVLFLSWSYGVKKRKEVEALSITTNTQWFRRVPWDDETRKSVLCELLRRQLSCVYRNSTDFATEKARGSICKEQIMILVM